MAILKLPQDPRTAVFRLLCKTLKTDPVLNRTVKTWVDYSEKITGAVGITAAAPAMVKLTPIPGAQNWYTPDSNIGILQVRVEYDLLSYDADDFMNFWGAIERALYPVDRDAELTIERAFVAAGAATGQWRFSQPAVDTNPMGDGDHTWHCVGLMEIDVERIIRS